MIRIEKKTRWLAAVLILLAIATTALLLSRSTPPGRPNVLWITMDSLRSDHLGCYGYNRAHTPNIDQLAAHSALFAECVSQASYTRISVPSMITAQYPFFLNMRLLHGDLDTSHVTAAEALATAGYFTCAIAEPWPPGFFQGLEMLDIRERLTPKKTQRCLQVLQDLDERPFFIWLYYWDPHAPYDPPKAYLSLVGQSGPSVDDSVSENAQLPIVRGSNLLLLAQLNRGTLTLTQGQRNQLMRLYDAEISYVDGGIGQILGALKAMDLWDNTMIILTADHGEAFGEHGLYYHSHSLYEEEVRVPCIIKPPMFHDGPKTIRGCVRNLDVLPTILDYCHLPPPADIQGQTLRPYIETDRRPRLASCLETHSSQLKRHLMAYRDGHYKLIFQLPSPEVELYDLVADPGERSNLLAENQVIEESGGWELEAKLQENMLSALGVTSLSALEIGPVPDMDRETREQLKALGYIE